MANIDAIKALISNTHSYPDFICITESRLHDKKIEWQKPLVKLPNYKLKYDNSQTSAGGVAIYVHDSIKNFEVKSEMKLDVPECESLFLEIKYKKDSNLTNISNEKMVAIGCK